ncbi:dihydroxyacetone kinase subunit L [Telmatospirillum sp.]|uniref:dihydroxyacetone kinase subunit L n=1 Tax=Telmatospirillum sp. TaxID=2079197 RepID=UPI002851B1F2|nr:dihydroxyacetone kinase subunit L [Telmatospirillum sp.]MDR3438205.1 dihydroxyacetone kinase subunit L [Telmatospirillum sp.]
MQRLNADDTVTLVGALEKVFADQREFLIALDGKVGDSDLGLTMNKAFTAAHAAVKADPSGTPGKLLRNAGLAIAKAAPSTMGTLTASGFMRGGKTIEAADTIGSAEMAAFWRAYRTVVQERGRAQVGDKTVLDVLDPIAVSLEASAAAGAPLETALTAAAAAAGEALEKTKTMVAQHGKAAAFQEKSLGLQDAGATVGVIIIETMADFVTSR